LYAHGGLRIEDVPKPEPRPGDVVVQVEVALAGGADLKAFRSVDPNPTRPPASFGRELCGFVEERRVVAAGPLVGACADWVLVPAEAAENVLTVPVGLASEVAALVDPLARCLRHVEESGVAAAETVAILGGGPLGLLLAACVTDAGALAVTVGGDSAWQELAAGFGATAADARGADVVIEVAEVEQGPSRHAAATVRAALGFLASGAYPWERLITHHILLADLPAFLAAPPPGLLKAAVVP
jgi:threonine dehydrogenase-like Zn-dependent dehydrogenase